MADIGRPIGVVSVSDYRETVKLLNTLSPTVIKKMRADIRQIAAPAQTAISNNIPSIAPLSGMIRVHHGKKTWDFGAPAKTVKFEMRAPKRSAKTTSVTLARLRVTSVGTVIADMAGRSGKYIDRNARTRPYTYRLRNGQDVERTHAINGQGRAMIGKLNQMAGRKASRFAWPAFETVGEQIQKRAGEAIKSVIEPFNRKLR